MNIAIVSQALPYLPSRGGFRLYGGNLIRQFSQRHSVDLISFLEEGDEEHIDWPKRYCSSVQTIPMEHHNVASRAWNVATSYLIGKQLHGRRRLNQVLREGLKQRRWDVLHIEGGAAGGAVDPALPIPKVLSLHDSWTLRAEEMLKCSQSASEKLYYRCLTYYEPRYERLVYPRFEAVTVVARPDLDAVREVVPKANVVLIPYGTDTEYFHPVSVQKEKETFVFHSHLGYPPNIEAALLFANEIFPIILKRIPQAKYHLVGANPGPKILELGSRPNIRISANLPDLRPAVCSGTVYACAIQHGTGLKSKMLEAMGMQMPIVAWHPGSTVGIEGVHGKHWLAATSCEEFAAHAVDLMLHPEKAEALAKAARQLVCEKYSWASKAQAYEELYRKVIQKSRVHAPVMAESLNS